MDDEDMEGDEDELDDDEEPLVVEEDGAYFGQGGEYDEGNFMPSELVQLCLDLGCLLRGIF